MVEKFCLTGKMVPTFSEVMRATIEMEITGTRYVPRSPTSEQISRTLSLNEGHEPLSYLIMYANVRFDTNMNPIPIDDKIAFFSRYGNNFEAVHILDCICDKYGCGYSSDADGVMRNPQEEM